MLDIELSLWLLLVMVVVMVGEVEEKMVLARLEEAVVDVVEIVILAVVEDENLEDGVANELEFMLDYQYKT